jgi:hypothetical protein
MYTFMLAKCESYGVRPQVASHRVPFIGVEVMHVRESCCGAFVCSCRHGARFNRLTHGVSNTNQDVV